MFHRFLNTQMPLFGFPFLGRSGGSLGEVFYKHFPSRNPFLHSLSERFGEVGRSFSKFHLFIDCYSSVSLPSLDNFHVWGRNLRHPIRLKIKQMEFWYRKLRHQNQRKDAVVRKSYLTPSLRMAWPCSAVYSVHHWLFKLISASCVHLPNSAK